MSIIVEGVIQYTTAISHEILQGAYTGVLINQDWVNTAMHGEQMAYRVVEFRPDGDYTGKFLDMPTGGSVNWVTKDIKMDRYMRLSIDYVEELGSWTADGLSSAAVLNMGAWRNSFANTFDAYNISTIVSSLPEENRLTYDDLDNTSIMNSILMVENRLRGQGVNGTVYVFMNSDTYGGLMKELMSKGGIYANSEVVTRRDMELVIPFGADQKLNLTTSVNKINNMIIIPVPNVRMNDAITVLPGHDGEGTATQGGYTPNKQVTTNSSVRMLFVTPESIACGFKVAVSQILLPPVMQREYKDVDMVDFLGLSGIVQNGVEIVHAGINQMSNDICIDNRFLYDTFVMEGMEDYNYSVEIKYTAENKDGPIIDIPNAAADAGGTDVEA